MIFLPSLSHMFRSKTPIAGTWILLVASVLVLALPRMYDYVNRPDGTPVVAGVLDLRSIDFEVSGNASLSGDWFVTSRDASSNIIDRGYSKVPSVWISDEIVTKEYSAKVIVPQTDGQSFTISMPFIYSDYELKNNYETILTAGSFAPGNGNTNKWSPLQHTFPPDTTELNLHLTIKNTDYVLGGFSAPIRFGFTNAIYQEKQFAVQKEVLYMVAFFLLAFYFFTFANKRNRSELWLGVYCLQICIYIGVFNGRYVISSLDWDMTIRFEYAALYSCILTFHLYVKNKFPIYLDKYFTPILQTSTLIMVSVTLFASVRTFTSILPTLFFISLCAACFYTFMNLIIRAASGQQKARLHLVAFLILTASAINDFFYNIKVIDTGLWVGEGLLIYLTLSAYIVQRFYTSMHKQNFNMIEQLTHQNIKVEQANKKIEDQIHKVDAAKEEADRALVSKTQFISVMSHEIRGPIAASYQILEVLDETNIDHPVASNLVRVAIEAMEPLFLLLHDIIDFSSLDYKSLSIHNAPFDFEKMVTNVHDTTLSQATENNVKLLVESSSSDIFNTHYLVSDATRLRQVLSNLVGNAIKYNKENGSASIFYRVKPSLHPDERYTHNLVIEVNDTGIGICEEHISEIFSMFTQVNENNNDVETRTHGGFGIGLTLCKQIIDLMDGELLVRSKKGQGSTFTVEIPVTFKLKGEGLDPTVELTDKFSAKILLVEDDSSIRLATRTLLHSAGVDVKAVSDAETALLHFKNEEYDIIFTDCYMPVMSGFELAENIRLIEQGDPSRQRTPIVGLSAGALNEVMKRATQSGMDKFMTKPYKKFELFNLIRTLDTWAAEAETMSVLAGSNIESHAPTLKLVKPNTKLDYHI